MKKLYVFALFAAVFAAGILQNATASAASVTSWWPVNNVTVSEATPFKGIINELNVNDYSMYWTVDNGAQTVMPTNYNDYPHKETIVDVKSWNWRGAGPYTITYIAKNNAGTEIGRTSFAIYKPYTAPTTTTTVAAPAPTKPFANAALYVDPTNNAKKTADSWRSYRPADATNMDKIGNSSQAKWLGGWNWDIYGDTKKYVDAASIQNKLPVMVAYNIPQRDCGSYSAGGTQASQYGSWIQSIANAIGTRKAVVIVEPDALAGIDCLNATDQATRTKLLSDAVNTLKQNPNTYVYLDAGHARWHSTTVMASRLKSANIAKANGFSLNISNFIATDESTTYGQDLSSKTDGKHFVIDTSRNGVGPTSDAQWCNPAGRALGERPTAAVSNSLIDAYLWIKTPGDSDGSCNGAPSTGTWMPEYALGLAQRAAYQKCIKLRPLADMVASLYVPVKLTLY